MDAIIDNIYSLKNIAILFEFGSSLLLFKIILLFFDLYNISFKANKTSDR